MTRKFTARIALLGCLMFIAFDLQAAPPNPFQAPSIIAWGSGASSQGGFCGALPQ